MIKYKTKLKYTLVILEPSLMPHVYVCKQLQSLTSKISKNKKANFHNMKLIQVPKNVVGIFLKIS